jgi:DNA-binding MarR family transcriptional regulator
LSNIALANIYDITDSMNHDGEREKLANVSYVALRRAYRLVDELTREELRPYELSPPQYSVLRHATADGVTISYISERMLADNGNLTRHIDKLEKRGLIQRAEDAADRRSWLIKLTPAGSKLMSRLRPKRQQHVRELFCGMSTAELQQLSALLVKLEQQLVTRGKRSAEQREVLY